ncbi:hypothetical protein BDN72DRAFT_179087 [Pluteus cervinus]|uniref:Uncharacterized protein n=1 Tax=Pluteus cervinus TaxID=181527 RepID=A0ACD3AJJ6_9AGAR|nr:hypothetical protein BDN72DRAFT_179087 [Pluteus cervinus]
MASLIPEDVLRDIFELSVRSTGTLRQATIFSRVSRAVHIWMKPLLLGVYICNDGADYRPWPVEPDVSWFAKNGRYIRHMLFGMSIPTIEECISLCPAIQNLAVWVNWAKTDISKLLPILNRLPLRRLSIDLDHLLTLKSNSFTPTDAQAPLFVNLTHLDLVNECAKWEELEGVAHLPNLTHLALPETATRDHTGAVRGALTHCKELKVLIVLYMGFAESVTSLVFDQRETQNISDDPRLVGISCSFLADWEAGALGRDDMWIKAEQAIAAR